MSLFTNIQRRLMFLGGMALVIFALGCTPKQDIAPTSVAVLYFNNSGGQASDDYFVDGFHGELLLSLSKIQSLKTIGQHSMASFRDSEQSPAEIAAALDVASIMKGSVSRSDDSVSINVQLINAGSGEQLWQETFERELTTANLVAIQSEIAAQITTALGADLTEDELARINLEPTEDLEAYLAYLRGNHLLRNESDENITQAIVEYKAAMERDQDFAAAWWGLGEAAYRDAFVGARSLSNGWGIAREAKEHALWLDENSGRGWGSSAIVRLFDIEPVEAQEAIDQALAFSPNDSLVHRNAKDFYVSVLQLDKAKEHMAMALELDPYWADLHADKATLYSRTLRDFATAEAAAKRAVELDPDNLRNPRTYAEVLKYSKDRWGEALAWQERAIEIDPSKAELHGGKALLLMNLGSGEGLQKMLPELQEVGASHYTIPMMDMWAAFNEGDFELAEEHALLGFRRNPRALASVSVSLLVQNDRLPDAIEMIEDSGRRWLEKPEEWNLRLNSRVAFTCGTGWMLKEANHEEFSGDELIQQTMAILDEKYIPYWKDPVSWSVIDCLAVSGKTEEALDAMESHLAKGHWDGWWWRKDQVFYRELAKDPRYDAMWEKVEQGVTELRGQLEEAGTL